LTLSVHNSSNYYNYYYYTKTSIFSTTS